MAYRVFASSAPFIGTFNSVVRSIAQNMCQGIAQCLYHFAVNFDFASVDPQFYFFAKLNCNIPNKPGKRREQFIDMLHTHHANGIAQFGHRRRQARK